MLKLAIPQLGDETLFEATLEPTASAVTVHGIGETFAERLKAANIRTTGDLLKYTPPQLAVILKTNKINRAVNILEAAKKPFYDKTGVREDMGEGEINTVLDKKNKVAVGVPYYENLISRLIEEKKEIPHEIKQMSDNYDFHFVSLSCSFLPDRKCRFIWARFGVELSASARSKDSRELLTEKPIAYDMFPDEVLSAIKYRRKVNFGPELKFNLGVINADLGFEAGESKELVIYEPQIFAFGIRTQSVAWDFKSTQEKGIWGNKRDLLLIVRAPKNSKVKGRFLLGAEVEVNIGKWIRIPLTKRKDEVVDAEYDLSK